MNVRQKTLRAAIKRLFRRPCPKNGLFRILSAFFVLVAPSFGLVTVTQTLYDAQGNAAGGSVIISWPTFIAANGHRAPAGSRTILVPQVGGSKGVFSVSLEPNDTMTDPNVQYTVRYHMAGGPTPDPVETWSCPTSGSPILISACFTTPSFPGSGQAWAPSGTNIYNTNTGNVLIGNGTAPTNGNYKLDVTRSGSTGTVRFYDQTATTGITRFQIRLGAGQASNDIVSYYDGTNQLGGVDAGGQTFTRNSGLSYKKESALAATGLNLSNSSFIGWKSVDDLDSAGTYDTCLYRNAAGIVEIDNCTPGTLRALVTSTVSTGDGTVAGENLTYELVANGTEYRSWGSPDALTATLRLRHANAVPTTDQVMRFPAPSSNISQYAWSTPAWLDVTNTFTGRQDASGAASTAPAKVGTSLPGTCVIGELYFKSDATAGQNIYECQSTNTWTQQGGGSTNADITFPVGTCDVGVAYSTAWWGLDVATANCISVATATGSQIPNIAFATTGTPKANLLFDLPQNYASGGAFVIRVAQTDGGTLNVFKMGVAVKCLADGTDLSVYPTFNTAVTVETATPTTNQTKTVTFSALSLSGCSAGSVIWLRLYRDQATSGTNYTNAIRVVRATFQYVKS